MVWIFSGALQGSLGIFFWDNSVIDFELPPPRDPENPLPAQSRNILLHPPLMWRIFVDLALFALDVTALIYGGKSLAKIRNTPDFTRLKHQDFNSLLEQQWCSTILDGCLSIASIVPIMVDTMAVYEYKKTIEEEDERVAIVLSDLPMITQNAPQLALREF